MSTCLVTGGAGFLGLAPVRRAAAPRPSRDLRRQPRDGLAGQHRAHPRRPSSCTCNVDIIEPYFVDEPVDFVYHLASPASPIDYLRLPLHTLKVGSYGTHHTLGLAKKHRARFLLASTSEVYGDPAGAPAARVLLGPRQPDRPARRLRRGQALRRGADDGLPPPAGRRHGDRPHLQHLRAADARRTTAARSRRSCARRCRTGRSRCSATARRRARSAYVERPEIRGLIALAESGYHHPVNIGNPDEFTLLELAKTVIEVDRIALGDRVRGAADRRPAGAPARHLAGARDAGLGARGRAARRPASARSTKPAPRRSSASPAERAAIRAGALAGVQRAFTRTSLSRYRYICTGHVDRRCDVTTKQREATNSRTNGAASAPVRSAARARCPAQAPAGAVVRAAPGDAAPRRPRRLAADARLHRRGRGAVHGADDEG